MGPNSTLSVHKIHVRSQTLNTHCGIDNMASIGKFLQHLPASSRDAGLPKIFSKTTVVSAATTRGFSNRMVCLRRLKIAAPFRWLNPEHIELIGPRDPH